MTWFDGENFRNVLRRKITAQAPISSLRAAGSPPSKTTRHDLPPSEPYSNCKKSSRRRSTATVANKESADLTSVAEKFNNQNVPQNRRPLSGELKSLKLVLRDEGQSPVPSSSNMSSKEDYSYSRLMELWFYRDQHVARESISTSAKQQQLQKGMMAKKAFSSPSLSSPVSRQERLLSQCLPPLEIKDRKAKPFATPSSIAPQLMPSLMDDDESNATSDGGTVTAHNANVRCAEDREVSGGVDTMRDWMNKFPPFSPPPLSVGQPANIVTKQSVGKITLLSKRLELFGNFHNNVLESMDEEVEFDDHFKDRTSMQAKGANIPQQQASQTETTGQGIKMQIQQIDHSQHSKHQVVRQQKLRPKFQRQIDEDSAETDQTGTTKLSYDESFRQQDREHNGIFVLPSASLLDAAVEEKSEISLPFDECRHEEVRKAGVGKITGLRFPANVSSPSGGDDQVVVGHEDSKYAIHDVIGNNLSMGRCISANSEPEGNRMGSTREHQMKVIGCRGAKLALLATDSGREAEQKQLGEFIDSYVLHQTTSTAHSAVTVQVRNNGRRKSIAIGDDDSDIDGRVDRIMSYQDNDQWTESDIFEGVSSIHDSEFGIGEASIALLDNARQSSPVFSANKETSLSSAQNRKPRVGAGCDRDEHNEGDDGDNYLRHLTTKLSRPPRYDSIKPETLQRHQYQYQQRSATKHGSASHAMSASSGSDVFDGLDSDVAFSTGNDINFRTDAGTFMSPFKRILGGAGNFVSNKASKQNNCETARASLPRIDSSRSIFKRTELKSRVPQYQSTNEGNKCHAHDDNSADSFSDIDNNTLFANLNDTPEMIQLLTATTRDLVESSAIRINTLATLIPAKKLRPSAVDFSTSSSPSEQNCLTRVSRHAQTKEVGSLATPAKQHIAPIYRNHVDKKAPVNSLFSVEKNQVCSSPAFKERAKKKIPGSTMIAPFSRSEDSTLAAPTGFFLFHRSEMLKPNLSANPQHAGHDPAAKEAMVEYITEKGSRAVSNTLVVPNNAKPSNPADAIGQATTKVTRSSSPSCWNLSQPILRMAAIPSDIGQSYSMNAQFSRSNKNASVKGHASVDIFKAPVTNYTGCPTLTSPRGRTTTQILNSTSLPPDYSCKTKQADSVRARAKLFESASHAAKDASVARSIRLRLEQTVSTNHNAAGGKMDQKSVDTLWSAETAVQESPISGSNKLSSLLRRVPYMTPQLDEAAVEEPTSSVLALPLRPTLNKEKPATLRPLSMTAKGTNMLIAFKNEASETISGNDQDYESSKESSDDENDCSLYKQDDELMHHLLYLKSTTPHPTQFALNLGEHVVLKSAADFAKEQSNYSDSQIYNQAPPRTNHPKERLLERNRWAPSMARLYKHKTTRETKKYASDKQSTWKDQKLTYDRAGASPSFCFDKRVNEAELRSEFSTSWSERSPDPRVTPKASSPRSVMNEITP